jgi:heme oxygenase (mycobilin-producing)
MSEPVVLINIFEVPASDAAEFIPAWEKTRDYLAQNPAHLDTSLHQAITPDADFQFVNIAHWRSAQEFTDAIASPGFQESARGLHWPMHPTVYTVVRTEEPTENP